MKQLHIHSIRFKLVTFILLIFILLTTLVASNNIIAINEIQDKIYDTSMEAITMYQNRLKDNFDTTEDYLNNFAYDDMDIRILSSNDTSTTQWFSSLYRVQKSFRSALPIYEMGGFFLYTIKGGTYMTETNSKISYPTSKELKNTMISLIKEEFFLQKENKAKWVPLLISDNYYLFRVIRIHDSYIGTWISTEAALQPLVGKELTNSIYLVSDTGTVLSQNAPITTLPTSKFIQQDRDQIVEINSEDNLLVSCKVNFGDAYIVSLIPEDQFFMDTNRYTPILLIALLIVFGLMVLAAFIINRWVIKPLTNLNNAIFSLRNGNLNTIVSSNKVSTEFIEVNNAFNEMVSEIKTLKIDVYEEKLSRQHIITQYLKLQIAPHFLINCLNMAYQLTEINRPDLMKMMLKDLSQHLRYTLSSGQTVSLKQELLHVENYIELSKIRYPNGVVLTTDLAPETMYATVIPLLIQNFVENTVKYEVIMGKTIIIHIKTSIVKKETSDYLAITIWDTGCGFSDQILKHLQDIDQYIQDTQSEHIGISNVFQRASLIYGAGNYHFHFTNRLDSGAQIDIEIPYIPFFIEEGEF